jgi:hypothetical protein
VRNKQSRNEKNKRQDKKKNKQNETRWSNHTFAIEGAKETRSQSTARIDERTSKKDDCPSTPDKIMHFVVPRYKRRNPITKRTPNQVLPFGVRKNSAQTRQHRKRVRCRFSILR